ncbi:MAG: ATP-dependent DNA helicase RecG [Alphaproteobacteria bacterium]
MRPAILFPLFAPVTSLAGIGPRLAPALERLAGPAVVDLLWHLPTGLIDRRHRPTVAEAAIGKVATLTLVVGQHRPPPRGNRRVPWRVACFDATAPITLVFFHARGDYLEKTLPVGATRIVSGTVEDFNGERQITHPDFVVAPEELDSVATVQPVYPLTAGVTPRVLGRAVRSALDRAPDLPEWLDPAFKARQGWPGWQEALRTAHAPEAEADLEPALPARQRLAYDELLAMQLTVALVRAEGRRRPGRPLAGDGRLRDAVVGALPFSLTGSQRRATEEIAADMASAGRMLRLLQGDVGSGKTVVALLAMLIAVEAGAQAALMAPTEILARQHHATIAPLAAAAGIEVALLTGREKGAPRARLLAGLADGSIPLVVGTHALIQDDVAFADLALAVIDEQHRFGVHQRLLLADKGRRVDVLVTTATPIPRTLMLAAYGDLDQSQLTEKPAGRKPIDTRTVPLARLDEVVGAVGRAMDQGAKVYWVCPLVEESEAVDLAAAEDRHKALAALWGDRVGLVHGRLKARDKDAVMARFAGTAPDLAPVDLLVATTVIEVGVDVPAASVMVIEHAERFGLAQLHQLRGRIGRGEAASTCLLLYAEPLGETARARLKALRESDDGFRIAEEDLRLRGAGDVLGTRQSGLPEFRLADLAAHAELLAVARDDAALVVERDPALATPRGEALRTLLYLFRRDAAVRTARAG